MLSMTSGGRPRKTDMPLDSEAVKRGQVIEKLRKTLKMSQTGLAGFLLGADQSYISKLERGTVDPGGVGVTRFSEIALAFGMTISELGQALEIESAPDADPMEHLRTNLTWAPIQRLGFVAGGDGDGTTPEPDGTYTNVPLEDLKKRGANPKNCFSYTVNGNSMFTEASRRVPRPIAHGDTVVIERGRMPRENDLVVLWDHVESKMLIKAVGEGDNGEYLIFASFNANYPPIVRTRDQVKLYGVVVWRGG